MTDPIGGKTSRYAYDAHGRRVKDLVNGTVKHSQYTSNGQLVMVADERAQKVSEYAYLQGSLIAIRERDVPTAVYTIKYQHTDALGTPIAMTGQSRNLLETSEYEPYGQLVNATLKDGPGFTGHVQDAATGLTYMQQRYYDPTIGRFLSVDPVTAYGGDSRYFNRHTYAFNNPYKFFDPDGRANCTGTHIQSVCDGGGVAGLQTSARAMGESKPHTRGSAIRANFRENIDNSILGPGGKKAMHFLGDEIVGGIGDAVDGNFGSATKSMAIGLVFKKAWATFRQGGQFN